MCGISGLIDINNTISKEKKLEYAYKVNSVLSHRGPDGHGVWLSDDSSVLLCHTRLSILDISDAGHQPMGSNSGRFMISYNGEIYNFLEIKVELEKLGAIFKSDSDTEVLVNAFEYWGIHKTLNKLTGMFAIALFDRVENNFYLIRDRFGIKPLYYGFVDGCLFFGSELKAITSLEGSRFKLNYDAISLYFRYGYINAPHSIFENVFKIEPGTCIKIEKGKNNLEPKKSTYWDITSHMLSESYDCSFQECADRLEVLLQKSVELRMRSDVPFGAFLSGGYDSSLIVALMQNISSNPISTYSIGFEDRKYNEADYAKAVAQRLGTNHTELYVDDRKIIEIIPKLSRMYDEPFADSSQIPTFIVSQLARKDVTVVLSGDGGDENFGGYNRYFRGAQLNSGMGKVPLIIRKLMARSLESCSSKILDNIDTFLPEKFKLCAKSNRFKKLAYLLRAKDFESIYGRFTSVWEHSPILNKDLMYHENIFNHEVAKDNAISACMLMDIKSYLPEDILAKVDRASMATSLETRVPFLDHHVAEFAAKIPMKYKAQSREGKIILRELLKRHNVWDIVDRPKAGFCVPIGEYFKSELKDWFVGTLNYKKIKEDGILDADIVANVCKDHFSNKSNNQHKLWSLVSFQNFLDSNRSIIIN